MRTYREARLLFYEFWGDWCSNRILLRILGMFCRPLLSAGLVTVAQNYDSHRVAFHDTNIINKVNPKKKQYLYSFFENMVFLIIFFDCDD